MPKIKIIKSDNYHPVLPYAGTSGWSGTETSYERAVKDDSSGRTSARQQEVLKLLDESAGGGLTWKELSALTGWHHGTASGALSVLHKANQIARLDQKRGGCKVYVSLDWVDGRETERQGNKKRCPHCGGAL